MVQIATLDSGGKLTPAQVPALATLGATATGEALIEAVDAAAARTAIGATAAGSAVLTAADAAAQLTALGAQPAADLDTDVTALDANAASALRVQQDARLASTYAAGQANRLTSILDRGQEDAVLAILGDSTGNETTEWFYLLVQWLAASHPAYTVTHRLWNDGGQVYDAPTTVQTGSGARTLTVYNGSVPGAGYNYPMTSTRMAAMLPVEPTTVVMSYGYNSVLDHYRRNALEVSYFVLNTWPGIEIVWVAQPPKGTGDADAANHLKRTQDVRDLASSEGWGIIDTTRAFLDYGDYTSDLVGGDGVHPTAAGSAVWLAEAKRYFQGAPAQQPRAVPAIPQRVFIPAAQFFPVEGSPAMAVTGGINVPYMTFDPTTAEAAVCVTDWPSQWKSVDVWIIWSTGGGSTDTVVWRVDRQGVNSTQQGWIGDKLWSSFTAGDLTTVTPSNIGNTSKSNLVYTRHRFTEGMPIAFRVRRMTAEAADTFASDVYFVGLLIVRAE